MGSAHRVGFVAGAVALVLASAPGRLAAAAPSPSSLTVALGGPAVPFSGGPITGSADGSGNVAPPTCPAPACESIPLTLTAPPATPAKSITLTITITYTPATGNPGGTGIDGLDIWLIDSAGATAASATLGSSPSTALGSHLDPGLFTLEISGENAAAQETYTGTAIATTGSASTTPGVTQSPVPLAFAPATTVSPVILGAEPQMSFERPVSSPKAGAGLNTLRGFVDWPVSSRTMIGTLWRTTNGGDSYRQLVDLTCAERQVPNCNTGGGGDTVNRVNNYDGTVNFGDQESLAQEAFASSIDHGDSFPAARQTAVTSTFTGVDRQWVSTVDSPGVMAGPFTAFELEGLYTYHIPAAGELAAGIGTDGIVRPAIPVIPNVSQSGPSRIDMQPGSHGSGWFYQSYRDGNFKVGAVKLTSYEDPTAWHIGTTSTDNPQVFPWIALDRSGNLYAVWVAPDGQLYYSISNITDPANDPTATPPGVPATKWTPKLKVNPPAIGSTVFPEMVAGDAGRLAITYMGTSDWTGVSDGAPAAAKWNTYVALSLDAMDANPVFQTGLVGHRVAHIGSVCTSGTTCVAQVPQGDRSLLDMIDVTMDSDGRVATVFTDNNNAYARQDVSLGSEGSPYVKVSKLANGPSLLSGRGPYAFTYPTDFRSAAAGDATWPNTATGSNIPSLDVLGAGISIDGTDLLGRIDLAEASAAGFTRDLAAYKGVTSTDIPATRFQYVLRWDSGVDTYYLAADSGPGGFTFYGGKLDSTNVVSNGNSAVGVAYRPQAAFTVTGQVQGNMLLLRGHLADYGLGQGSTLISFAGYSLAGPADTVLAGQTTSSQIVTIMRNIDAAPPIDAVLLGPETGTPEAPVTWLLVLGGVVAAGAVLRRRRQHRE